MLAKQIKRREALKKAKAAAAAAEKTNLNVLTQEYKNKICENSYIGKKGYTIPREHLTPEDISFLHENLHVKAESFGPKYGAPTDEVSFPVYRENAKKIYIPRFYGIERYGLPTRSDLEPGDPISVEFVKELRDYQDKIIDVYMKHVTGDQNGSGGILEVPCGKGKCLAFNTPILMYDGCIKPVQDVIVGDLLMGDDSTPRRVLSLARGRERMYNISQRYPPGTQEKYNSSFQSKITERQGGGKGLESSEAGFGRPEVPPIHGERYTVNESHILSLKYEFSEDVRDISVKDYLNLPKLYYLGSRGRLMGYRVPVDFPEKEITGPDPYQVGFTYSGVLSNEYKCNSREIRLRVLAGILDKMGEYKTTFYNIDITQHNKDAADIVYLARSLGYSIRKNNYCIKIYGAAIDEIPVQVIDRIRKQNIAGLNKSGLKYPIVVEPVTEDQQYSPGTHEKNNSFQSRNLVMKQLYPPGTQEKNNSFQSRNLVMENGMKTGVNERWGGVWKTEGFPMKGLESSEAGFGRPEVPPTEDQYYGFEIDGNRRFVLGDFTVTHNTVMALKIISLLQKKTLIIVHKEFLMNQWIERAAEFIPSAKIGKIQGPIFDVQGKDVVIGMLQTLYDREFPEGAFDSFGLTIVDEVHRIGSEQFSKTLLRTITRNMLGISATVDRKDGLTRVLHMFIGPKIYSEERKSDDPVCVRAIDYISADPEFNEILYDQRGNPKYSTMISKLCDFGPRSDFIVRVLGDLIKENDEKQIMVLGHNRSLLKYLHEAIVYRGFASVGYYVGGMKQVDLQKTEEKQIVLATYAMAAEALDIKTLSTLVMVTPKTDIVQSVGRILRVKHDNPIIVDIVDRHDLFQNQFKQRKTFYRKCNYRIVSMDSVRYNGFPEDYMKSWTKVFEPKATYALESEPKEHKCLIKFDNLDSD